MFGEGLNGWLTGPVNKTLGPIYFPKFGRSFVDIHNPDTVLQVSSTQPLAPDDLLTVFGSPAPALPVKITLLISALDVVSDDNEEDFPDPLKAGQGLLPTGDEPPQDADGYGNGPTLPLLELQVAYVIASAVTFNLSVRRTGADKVVADGCGHRFRLVGSTLTLTASIDQLRADGIVQSTMFTWQVSGAAVVAGVMNAPTSDATITLSLDTDGFVTVSLSAVVTTQIGSGIQMESESGRKRRRSISMSSPRTRRRWPASFARFGSERCQSAN